ncbi:MAG: glycoside hydrolase family 3 protein [Carbonactinosporaceae bacterium]
MRDPIAATISRMTLEEKVGQLFVTYAYGASATTTDPEDVRRNRETHGVDNAAQLVDRYRLGGVVHFAWSRNVNDPRQVAELSNGLQRAALRQPVPIPLIVATDQEHGIGTRIGPPATQLPGNMALGAGRSVEDAYTAARIGGAELAAVGVTQNFAPVADVNVNPLNPVIGVRSYGEDTALVAGLTAAQVRGYQDAATGATVKHFPGHGDTATDSHTGLPVIDHTREEWRRIDAPPFEAAVEEHVDMVMTAHVVVPALDPSGDPATLSGPIVSGVLRERLGYDGVVSTDALGMAGVRRTYGDDRVPVLALQAGVDILVMPPDLGLAYDGVVRAVRSGQVSERRLDRSVSRILALKLSQGLFQHPYVDVDALESVESVESTVGTARHRATAQAISDRTVTLVANGADLLPLPRPPRDVLVTGWGETATAAVAEAFGRRGCAAAAHPTGSEPARQDIGTAVEAARGRELTVVTTNQAWRLAAQRELVGALAVTGTPVVVVAVRDPYDIARFAEAPTALATYSHSCVSLESAVRVMLGEVCPTGRLPVTIREAGDRGAVLYRYGHGLSYPG